MHDADLRRLLRSRLAQMHRNDQDSRIVEEMGVWSNTVRIDVAVISDEIHGFEIKSDRDTLKRLPKQAKIYGMVFDRVTLVVGERHATAALDIVPSWWGCLLATHIGDVPTLCDEREATQNPSRDPLVLAKMLWKPEAVEIMEAFGLAKGWRSRTAADISKRLSDELPLVTLSQQVRNSLLRRERLGMERPVEVAGEAGSRLPAIGAYGSREAAPAPTRFLAPPARRSHLHPSG